MVQKTEVNSSQKIEAYERWFFNPAFLQSINSVSKFLAGGIFINDLLMGNFSNIPRDVFYFVAADDLSRMAGNIIPLVRSDSKFRVSECAGQVLKNTAIEALLSAPKKVYTYHKGLFS